MRRSICSSNTACSRANTLASRFRTRCGSSGATAGKKSDTFGIPTHLENSVINYQVLELPGRRLPAAVIEVDREYGAGEQVQHGREHDATDVDDGSLARQPRHVRHEPIHLLAAEMLLRVESVWREELRGAQPAEGAPLGATRRKPDHGEPVVPARADGIRHRVRGEGGVVALEDLSGGIRGGGHDGGDWGLRRGGAS
ncbi:hypothetical protein GUJ93_ZPchr0013g35526 [Zizania palustris]|uniref:Uncharacterized protein n=1 Tax=Zizania palustris TaxID=103762 RepID=A0A8J6BVM0_ZIZPA|nr:hypothetical protein GUJ93_ZPchr0013g35526 [Zizania palustris]